VNPATIYYFLREIFSTPKITKTTKHNEQRVKVIHFSSLPLPSSSLRALCVLRGEIISDFYSIQDSPLQCCIPRALAVA
jgi:hypothetical protein